LCAHFLLTPSTDQQLPLQGIEAQRADGAPAKETAHYSKMALRRMGFEP